MKMWQIIAVLIAVLVGGILIFLYKLAAYVARPAYHTTADMIERMKEQGFWRDYEALARRSGGSLPMMAIFCMRPIFRRQSRVTVM